MKNAPAISFTLDCRKGSGCPCPGYTFTTIEREGRLVGELIGQAAVRMMSQGIRPKYVLIGRSDYHLLMNEIDRRWADGPLEVNTPAGKVLVLVDPAVELGVRALPEPGQYYRLLDNPKLLEPQ